MSSIYFEGQREEFDASIKFTSVYVDGIFINRFYSYGIAHHIAISLKNAFNSVLLVDFISGEVLHEF